MGKGVLDRQLFTEWWKNPSFGNPYVQTSARNDINQNYGGVQPSGTITSPVLNQPQTPPTARQQVQESLPSEKWGILPMVGYPNSDITYGAEPGMIDQGIGALQEVVNDNITIRPNTTEYDKTDPFRLRISRDGKEVYRYGQPSPNAEYDPTLEMEDVDAEPMGEYETPTNDPVDESTGTGIDGLPKTPETPDVTTAEIEKRNFLEANKDPDETLEAFAERIGIPLSDKPYSNWDYIRDMSTGLLASDDDEFLGALGDASLYSNKNRDTAYDADRATRNTLAIAKWKSEEEKEAARESHLSKIKLQEMKDAGTEIKNTLAPIGRSHVVDGVKVTDREIVSGYHGSPFEVILPNGSRVYRVDDTDVDAQEAKYFARKDDLINTIDIRIKSERMDDIIQARATDKTYQGIHLSQARKTGELKALTKEMIANKIEGAKLVGELVADGKEANNAEIAAQLTSALEGGDRVFRSLYRDFQAGLYNNLNPSQQAMMKYHIGIKASDLATAAHNKNPKENYSADDFIMPATNWVMDHMKWDQKGDDMFTFDSTTAQDETMRLIHGDSLGKDLGDYWWSSDMEAQELSPYDARHDDTTYQTPYHTAGENSLWNLDQYELAKPEEQRRYLSDSSALLNKLEANAPHIASDELGIDIKDAMMDANLLRGGEDKWWARNNESRYEKPESWSIEPELVDPEGNVVSREQLRDAKYQWQGFMGGDHKAGKGHWFTYEKQNGIWRRKPLNEAFKALGYKFNEARSVKY